MFDEWRASPAGGGTGAAVSVEVPGKPESLADAEAVTYRTDLGGVIDPAADVVGVTLNGLYAHAEITVDGEILGRNDPVHHDAYFEPLHLPIRPQDGELVVTCSQPKDRFGGLYATDQVPATAAVPGIWWDATTQSHTLPYVASLSISPTVEDARATLRVRAMVVSGGSTDERLTLSLRPSGTRRGGATMERLGINTDSPGISTIEHEIEIREPDLWWPAELGAQHRYTLRAKLGESELSVTTGLRDVDWDGDSIRVNGEPIRIRGVNVLTADPADVERATDLNANLIRGHAHVLPPAVYEACDEAGLLVWQDLPLTGPGEFDVERGQALARRLVRTYGRHPSLAAVTVHDEPTAAFADGLGSGFLDRLRMRWRAWRTTYDRDPAEEVASTITSLPVFPVVGGPGIDPDGAAYYPGWDYGEPADVTALLQRYPAPVLAEYGAASMSEPDQSLPTAVRNRLETYVGTDLAASRRYQSTLLRTVTSAVRRDGLPAIAFALRDVGEWGMGVFESDGEPKPAADALESAFEPVQAFLHSPGRQCTVVVVNDLPSSVSPTVRWSAGDAGGSLEVEVPARDTAPAGEIRIPADASTVELVTERRDRLATHRYEI